MLEVCASKIGDIILSVLESKMENKLDEVKKAKIISDTRKSICEFEEKYLQNHDGTVLTSREFGEYLQYSKPIEEIFSTIWDTSTEIAGTTEIVEKLSTQCIESIKEKGRTIPPTENHLIKHFFEASVEIVSKMAREAITPGERMTQMQIKDLRNDMDGKLAGIQAQLNQRERLSPEEEKSIFDALYTILCSGEVHQIQKLVPLFQKKSDSIERALSVLIQLMAGEGNSPEVIVESIQKIENCYVRNIVIRFIIAYGFLWKEVVYALRQSVTIPYGQFVHIAFRDSMIVIRSDSHLSITATKNTRYVLSFSAAIFFMQAGIIAEDLIQNNVYIPESLHELLDMEWSKTLQDKSREKIATMMFDQGQPIIHEESDEEKRYFIQEAGKRKSESEKLKFIKNNKSINIHGRDDIQLQDLFGICDYDALSIAVHQDFTLVAFEPLLIAMSQKELLNFQCTGIVDFLCVTDFPLDKILKVICFMAKCKFEKILSDEIISVLIQKFDEVESDEEREKCMTLWFEFFDVLDKKEDESEYKGLFVQNVLIALQAYLRKGGSEQEIRNLTRKPMIKVAICLLYNSKCIDLQYDEKRVLPTTEQEMGKNG